MKRVIKNFINIIICKLFSFFSLKKSVFFDAYGGLYACNPRCISEALHKKHPDIKQIWNIKKGIQGVPPYIQQVQKNSFNYFKALFTSKICVFNSGIIIPRKRKGQFFLDTWHGDRAFKDVSITPIGEKSSIAYQQIDVVLSGSDYADRIYREQLCFTGEILKTGSPRNDLLFKFTREQCEKIKNAIGGSSFDSFLLYAPTYRNLDEGKADLNFSTLLDRLEERDQKKWCCLVRQHYKVKYANSWCKDSRIINVSKFPDVNELLLLTDILISDYSSIVGDFVLLKRPVVLYVPDLDEYNKAKGLNFKLNESPFIFAETESDLYDKIVRLNADKARDNCESILDFYGNVCEDGHATDRVIRYIEGILG